MSVVANKLPIIAVTGPTASGKSDTAVRLAKLFSVVGQKAEIISADSVAVYRGFDIGTAKPSLGHREDVPHHLIDIRDWHEEFTAAHFVTLADELIQKLLQQNTIPILVGGTGFYLRALFQGMTEQSEANTEHAATIKKELEYTLAHKGVEILYNEMIALDPELARRIHPNDHYRVIRALQAMRATGQRWSELNDAAKTRKPRYETFRLFCLDIPKAELEVRVAHRTKLMLESGLLAEVTSLLAAGVEKNAKPMQSVGYRESLDYLEHKIPEHEWQAAIVRHTLHLAKQQRTWFRGEKRVEWISGDPLTGIVKALGLDGMLAAQ